MNHAPILSVASLCAILGTRRMGPLALVAVLFFSFALPSIEPFFDPFVPRLYERYLTPSAGLLFALYGAAWGTCLTAFRKDRVALLASILAALVTLVALCFYHRFGAANFVAGFIPIAILERWPDRTRASALASSPWPSRATAALCAVLLAAMLYQQAAHRLSLPRGPFAECVAANLAQDGESDAMLVGAPDQLLLQARTGHAVFCDMALPFMITYVPAIAPSVEKMFNDVYGICFDPTSNGTPDADKGEWKTNWAARSCQQWQALGERYSFRYVIAPITLRLDLPLMFYAEANSLYRIPY